MLIKNKRKDNITWYKDDSLLYRVKSVDDKAIVWVNFNGYNIAMKLLMWDFLTRMEDNDILLSLDKQWNGHVGFVVNKNDVSYFIGLIEIFIDEFDFHASENEDKYADAEWYS